jgi:[acyl-carrier-protein] S-malonyltransferase
MRLVAARSKAMAQAAAAEETGMTAVLGGDESEVLAVIEACGLTPANINAAGQIVAAGTLAQLAALEADPPAGARLRPLSVAGAFHSPHMAPAGSALREAAAGISAADPAMMLLSNLDGAVVTSGTDWLERIIAQVSAPVRWQECMRTMAREGAAAIVELLPGGTLTGLARRALPGVATVALKTPDDLAAARSLIAEHGAPDPDENGHRPEWRLLVAPQDGTFRAQADHPGQALTAGAAVASGAALGHVEVRSGQHAIAPAFAGTIIEWLVEDGDPVNAGQPLVRLQPEGAE